MRRLFVLLRHQWRLQRGTALVALALWTLAALVAVSLGEARARRHAASARQFVAGDEGQIAHYRRRAEAIERVRAGGSAEPVRLHPNELDWGPTQPLYVAAWVPMKVVVPPAPLAALAQGEAELRPLAYRVSLFGPELVPVVEPAANPLAVTVGRFDLALATVWLLPVLVIALCYGLSAADRDAGILPLVLSQPLSPRALLAARLAIPILWVVAAVGVVAVVTAAVVRPEGSSWSGRLAAWLATSLAYGLLWVALGAAVDGRGRPAAWNALVLAGAWLLSTWVLPAAMQTVAAAAHPVPSRAVWAEDLRVFQDAREKGQDALTAQAKEALVNQLRRQEPSLAATRPAADTLGYYYFTRAAHEVAQEPQRRRLDDRMAAPLRRQEALVSALRFLSPSALALGALTDAAGAGRGRYEHFLAEAGRYDARYKAFLWPRTFGNALIASREFDLIPRFAMSEEPFRAAWGRVRAPLAALVSLSVALFTFAFAAGVTARGRPRVLTGERPALRRARGTLRA